MINLHTMLATGLHGTTLAAAGVDMGTLIAVTSALAIASIVLFTVFVARRFLYVCAPNEVLIFTGSSRGSLIIRPRGDSRDPGAGAGRKWRVPIIERVDRMDMTTMSIDIVVQNAYSAGNIPLQIHAIANVKIHNDPALLRNAVERFLGQSRHDVRLVAQQTLEGALREVLAQLTPEQVNEDRLAFADNLIQSAQDDLDKLGLQLDTLKIQNVSDSTGYLDSLGRPSIAQALRDAENAENAAMQIVTQAQAGAHRRAEVAKALADTAIVSRRNQLDEVVAGLDGQARAVEREAEVAAKTVRAQEEQRLQHVRTVLEHKRLQAEVVIPAEVQREAKLILAKGDAAATVEDGKAMVEVLKITAEAWKAMGPHAREVYVIQHIEEIIAGVVKSVGGISVGEVSILDPGDGSGLSSYAAAYPQAIAAVLRSVREMTGVDVPSILTPDNRPSTHASGGPSRGQVAAPALRRPAALSTPNTRSAS